MRLARMAEKGSKTILHRQGRIKGGATGAIAPGPPL